MTSRSAIARAKMKEEDPEKYLQYRERERERCAARRSQKKEKWLNEPHTQAMEQAYERELELARIRANRYYYKRRGGRETRSARGRLGKTSRTPPQGKRPKDMTPDEYRMHKNKRRMPPTCPQEAMQAANPAVLDDHMPLKTAARQYPVPWTSLRDHVVAKKPYTKRYRQVLSPEEEEEVVSCIQESAQRGHKWTKEQIFNCVEAMFANGKKKNALKNNRPGEKWFQNFMQRHQELKCVVPEEENAKREAYGFLTHTKLRRWFNQAVEDITAKNANVLNHPERIFTCDHLCFQLDGSTSKDWALQTYKRQHLNATNKYTQVTVLACGSASGEFMQPLLIFPGQKFSFKPLAGFPEAFFSRSDSGWINKQIFKGWIKGTFIPMTKSVEKPLVLFIDREKYFLSFDVDRLCRDHDIILYSLPSLSCHKRPIAQPLDLSCCELLKCAWSDEVRKYEGEMADVLSKRDFSKVFRKVWESFVQTDTLVSGFRDTGIYPWQPDYVSMKSKVTATISKSHTETAQATETTNSDTNESKTETLMPNAVRGPTESNNKMTSWDGETVSATQTVTEVEEMAMNGTQGVNVMMYLVDGSLEEVEITPVVPVEKESGRESSDSKTKSTSSMTVQEQLLSPEIPNTSTSLTTTNLYFSPSRHIPTKITALSSHTNVIKKESTTTCRVKESTSDVESVSKETLGTLLVESHNNLSFSSLTTSDVDCDENDNDESAPVHSSPHHSPIPPPTLPHISCSPQGSTTVSVQEIPFVTAIDRLLELAAKAGTDKLIYYRTLHDLNLATQLRSSDPEEQLFHLLYSRLRTTLSDVQSCLSGEQVLENTSSHHPSQHRSVSSPKTFIEPPEDVTETAQATETTNSDANESKTEILMPNAVRKPAGSNNKMTSWDGETASATQTVTEVEEMVMNGTQGVKVMVYMVDGPVEEVETTPVVPVEEENGRESSDTKTKNTCDMTAQEQLLSPEIPNTTTRPTTTNLHFSPSRHVATKITALPSYANVIKKEPMTTMTYSVKESTHDVKSVLREPLGKLPVESHNNLSFSSLTSNVDCDENDNDESAPVHSSPHHFPIPPPTLPHISCSTQGSSTVSVHEIPFVTALDRLLELAAKAGTDKLIYYRTLHDLNLATQVKSADPEEQLFNLLYSTFKTILSDFQSWQCGEQVLENTSSHHPSQHRSVSSLKTFIEPPENVKSCKKSFKNIYSVHGGEEEREQKKRKMERKESTERTNPRKKAKSTEEENVDSIDRISSIGKRTSQDRVLCTVISRPV